MLVSDAIASHACSTALVAGLSRAIIREMLAMEPGCLVPVASPQVHADSHVHTLLQPLARESLMHVLQEREATLIVNSCFRTLPEQAMVRAWAEAGRCGVKAAAPVGTSLHEQGLAIDAAAAHGWRDVMAEHGWQWLGPDYDPPHFQFRREGVRQDIAALSVRAFQRLVNRHGGALAEDGSFGPRSEAALLSAPAAGWTG